MKTNLQKKMSVMVMAFLCMLMISVPAFAAELTGHLDTADSLSITGWAWNSEDAQETVAVELHIYKDDSKTASKVVTVSADQVRPDLDAIIGSNQHSFRYPIQWKELDGNKFRVEAYAVSGETKTKLSGSATYTKPADTSVTVESQSETTAAVEAVPTSVPTRVNSDVDKGPGVQPKAADGVLKKGKSLGIFTTTGYCSCDICSSGHGFTFSGTVPTAGHTISADIMVLPLGTKVIINDVVYTVEDIGSSVNGNKVDIFYATHEEAWNHGVQTAEVFMLE